ncbi:MAG: CYTH domain-containing protein [Candidatus Omnitrophica bacterium]|nr:CYTH domain-containing protein [Candidatus Omnitrophota bacterium]MDD5671046.1 CYTH domain-containing protein [Candidatus Omnitrophota bacterium]
MKEIEVKILEVPVRKMEAVLKRCGARKAFAGKIRALYFDFADGRLARQKSVFRLRQIGDRCELAFKRWRSKRKAKIMDEFEIPVTDFEKTRQILDCLGMKVIKSVKKYRVSYRAGRTHFELDTYAGIPTLLEIESPSLKGIKTWVRKIGYSLRDVKPWSSFDVLKYYGRSKSALS